MVSKDVRFYRDQAARCSGLARLIQELGRQLTDMAQEYDERAEEAEKVSEDRSAAESSPQSVPPNAIEPLTLSIKDASRLLGLGRSTIYKLIGEQHIEAIKIGNRTLIKTTSIRRLLDSRD